MDYKNTYDFWLNHPSIQEEIKEHLKNLSEEQIKECFYSDLEFGTAGMRGIIGIGTNRLNIYTIRKATLGYANYLLKHVENCKEKGVVIGHDNRHQSREFCIDCANLLSSKGIKVYIFDNLRPTPEISFAIRHLKASGGIIITASHNPKEYNGYKVYDETGCQLIDEKTDTLIKEIKQVDDIIAYSFSKNENLIEVLDSNFDDIYYEEIKKLSLNTPYKKDFKIVYSPQHGAALNGVKKVLSDSGYNVHFVESQCSFDPNFSNTLSANPEDEKAYVECIKLANKIDADLILTSDPDGDRIGVGVKHKGNYVLLSGNQTGTLLLDYLLTYKKHSTKDFMAIASVVTTSLIKTISEKNNVFFKQTLTGFKYIGNVMTEYQDDKEFLFAVEESYGSALSPIVRDKDAIQAALIISEMSCLYHNQNITLVDKLDELHNKYGYCYDKVTNHKLDPLTGKEQIIKIMNYLRANIKDTIGDYKIKEIQDYFKNIPGFPKSNLLKFIFEDDSFIAIRPSGTEPKYKIYYSIIEKDENKALLKFNALQSELNKIIAEQTL